MRIAFSTVGCPDFDWVDIYTMAKDFLFDGIEIRGIGRNIHAATAAPFTPRRIQQTIQKLSDLRLSIPCLSTNTALKSPDDREAAMLEITETLALARQLGTPCIRVLADREPTPGDDAVDDEAIASTLVALAHRAEGSGVTLLVETNGVYADTARLRKLLDRVGRPEVAALWDMHHPYRFFGEQPEVTVRNLGHYIRHVHAKDSVAIDGRIVYKMMGEGDLPIYRMLDCLTESGFDGFVSLEWVKRWMPDLTDVGVVFPHFAHFMQTYAAGALQTDDRGTGKYPWPKEHLLDLTFPEVLDRVVKDFPDQYAFRYTTCDYTRTYAEFRDDVDTFARSLIAMGVKRGDHVAIWATNIPQWFITFWATVRIGAVLVTVNTAYKVHEAEYLLRQSDTHTLVMIDGYKDSNYVQIIHEICPELKSTAPGELFSKKLPHLRNVISCESDQPGCFSWDAALKLAKDVPMSEVYARSRRIDRHDVCNMQYTSGTTGFPKGVMLTHYNVVNNGKAIGDCMDLSSYDQLMIQVPMFHCFGMVLAMTAAMTHATTMSPIPYFSPKVSLECIRHEPITAFHGVPTMFIAMLEHPDFAMTDFSRLRTGIMAGSPCPVKVMQDVVDKMHMSEICITYGLTEASPATTMSKTTDSLEARVSTVGGPIYAVECKVVDPETGEELPNDTDGEFCARGYNIMKGYYKMPEATAAVIDEDGWLHTGDVARRTADGYYKITGRIKDMIIRGGENIYPKEIEEFLYTHAAVKDVQVIGVPDKQYGEEIMACVVLKEGAEAGEAELREYCLSHMAKHKCPRYFDFVTEFPMNAAGKILKYRMREEAIEKLHLSEAGRIVTA